MSPKSWTVAALLLLLPGSAWANEAPQLHRLTQLHQDLILDQPLDRIKLERLRQVALEDDLVITAAEAKLLESFIAAGYQDPTGEPAPSVEATFNTPLKGWVERARRWLVIALQSGVGSGKTERALRQLTALAWRDDLSADDREAILVLLDNVREVDRVARSRDAYEALTLIVTNPDEVRRDRDAQRELEMLAKKANMPYLSYTVQASASLR